MGTSASSKGPGAGVSFDPPWLDEAGSFDLNEQTPSENVTTDSNEDEEATTSIAPPARFRNARISLGNYVKDRSKHAGFKKAAGHYSQTGMGGSHRLAHRMHYATATGARLADFLRSTSQMDTPAIRDWVNDIAHRGLSGQMLIDAIIQEVAASSGSKDEASAEDSMAKALGEFLENHDNGNLLNLEADDIREITECFLANEACNRLVNDIGQIFESEKIPLKDSISLLNEMREYLRADLSVQMQSLWKTTPNPTRSQLNQILKSAIQRTFEIYEGEI